MRSQDLETGVVLIETYWNVNWEKSCYCRTDSRVLIETYWNVNSKDDPLHQGHILY